MSESITEQTEERVAAVIDRLRREYGQFAVVEKTWERSAREFDRLRTQFEHNSLDGAGVWLRNDSGEVLLVRNEGDAGWADPGGKVEPGESYAAAAKRELREETGVDCTLTGIREVHRIRNVREDEPSGAVFEVIVVFDGEFVGGTVSPRDGEIAAAGWFREPPDTVLYDEVRTRPYPATE